MWKTLCLLSLTLFTFDFLRVSLVRGEPVPEDDVLVTREEDTKTHRAETRTRAETRGELTGRRIHEDEKTSELVGKWRNNGEALEPKWRDGDSVPVLPFPRFSRYSGDKLDGGDEQEESYVRRRPKYRQNNEQENSLRSRNNGPLFYDYEDYDHRRGYRERELLPRKKTSRPWTNHDPVNPKKTNNRNEQLPMEAVENRETTSARYRDTLQARPNDYELELRISEEEYLKPRPRKRKPPQNYEFALVKNETLNEEIIESTTRRPQKTSSKDGQLIQNAMELKSLLKMQQEEGLSLSEILQRRNLTLNDLLKGRADAIDALKTKNVDETEDYIEEATKMISDSLVKIPIATKPQWPTFGEPVKATNSRKDELIIVYSTNPPLRKYSKEYSSGAVSRNEMYAKVEESTTRKSILTATEPSAPSKVTTSIPLPVATNSMELLRSTVKSQNADEIKADSPDEDEIMEFSDFTDYKKGRNGVSPVWLMMNNEEAGSQKSKANYEDRGSTLSIEKILSPTERTKLDNDSSDAQQFNLDDTGDYTSSEREYQNDAPPIYLDLEHSTRINSFIDESETREIEPVSSTDLTLAKDSQTEEIDHALKNHQDTNTTEKSYDDVISEVEPEARAEIFELFASGSAGKRLERLLKSRNMSLEELIALRQRGSSKVHLAEVSRIKVQKLSDEYETEDTSFKTTTPIPKTDQEPATNEKINDYLARSFQNVTNCNSISSAVDVVRSEEGTSEKAKISDENSSFDARFKDDEVQDIKKHHHPAQIIDLLTTFGSMPFAKDIQRDFVGEYDNRDETKAPTENNDQSIVFVNNDTDVLSVNENSTVVQSGYVKEIVEQKPNSIRTTFNEIDTEKTIDEKRKTLSNVKRSIIASGAILGVTIVVFLAIFIVCRIRQKQKYRYRNTFSRAVFQGPVMAARKLSNSSSLSTVMVNVVATSTTKRPEKNETEEPVSEMDSKSDIDNDSLDANDSWETIPDYMK
ncbi:uncharacterized protein LOC105663620 [Megachile rotundata]|uniref:uncharacterized protein LOC105663620 n=1 Tax=Megachile rotundata TaxID=143995 RepID=UPI003FD6BD23